MRISDLKAVINSFDDELEITKVDIITKDGYGGGVVYNYNVNDSVSRAYDDLKKNYNVK